MPRRISVLTWLGIALAGLLALVLSLVIFIMTPPGRIATVMLVERLVSSADMRLDISGSSGRLPLDVAIERITLSDADGTWLEISGLRIDGHALALLRGRVVIDTLSADRIHLGRLPEGDETSDSGGGTVPALPLRIDRFSIGNLVLDEPVAGTPADITLAGTLDAWIDQPGVRLTLDATRQDGDPATLALSANYQPDPFRLDASIDLHEERDGLFQTSLALARRDAYGLKAEITAAPGTLDGDLTLTAGQDTLLSGRVGLSGATPDQRFSLDLNGDLTGILPAPLDIYLGGPIALVADAEIATGDHLTVHDARLTARAVQASADGTLSLGAGSDDFSLSAMIRPPDTDVAGPPDAGASPPLTRADLFGRVLTRDGRSTTRLHLGFNGIDLDGIRAETGGIALTGQADAASLAAATRLDASLSGDIATPLLPGIDLADVLGPHIRLQGQFAAERPDQGGLDQVTVDALTLHGSRATTAFSGAATTTGANGTIRFDLGDETTETGLLRGGSGSLTADGQLTYDLATLAFDLDGTFADLAFAEDGAAGLFDGDLTLSGRLARSDGGPVELRSIEVTGSHLSARLDGSAAMDALDLAAQAAVTDLARANPALAGRLDLTATISGTAAHPLVDLDATGRDMRLMGRAFDSPRLSLTTRASDGGLDGSLRLTGTLDGQPVDIAADGRRADSGATLIDRIDARIADATATGRLDIADPTRPTGQLAVDIPDLATVGPLILRDLAGALTADIALSDTGDGALTVTADGRALAMDGDSIDRLSAEIHVADPFATRRTRAIVDIENASIAGIRLDSGRLTADPATTGTDYTAALSGPDGRLDAAGTVTSSAERISVALAQATLTSLGTEARLTAPTVIDIADGAVSLAPTGFAIADGRLDLSGTAGEALALDLAARNVPLDIAGAFVPDLAPQGRLTASAKVTGRADTPEADWSLAVTGASIATTRDLGLPAIALDGSGRLAGNRVQATVETTAGPAVRLTSRGSVGLDARGAIDVATQGQIGLSVLHGLLAEAAVLPDGTAEIAVTLGGRLRQPTIDGTVTLAGASVALTDLGIRLQNVGGRVRFDDSRARIERFDGTFATGGSLSVTGAVAYGGASGPDLDLAIAARNAVFLYEDFVTARLSADLTATGIPDRTLSLDGTVDLEQADIRIPETLPQSSLMLDVVHENAPAGIADRAEAAAAKPPPDPTAAPGVMDIRVTAPGRIFVRGRGGRCRTGRRADPARPAQRAARRWCLRHAARPCRPARPATDLQPGHDELRRRFRSGARSRRQHDHRAGHRRDRDHRPLISAGLHHHVRTATADRGSHRLAPVRAPARPAFGRRDRATGRRRGDARRLSGRGRAAVKPRARARPRRTRRQHRCRRPGRPVGGQEAERPIVPRGRTGRRRGRYRVPARLRHPAGPARARHRAGGRGKPASA